MALLKVLLLLGLGVSVNSDISLQKRIIGGQNCEDTERLYHVRLEITRGDRKIGCGGSLIHPQWILTSRHCMAQTGWTIVAMLKIHPRTVIHYNQIIRDDPVIYTHDDHEHDLTLMKLQTPVTNVPLARLPDCNNRLKIGDIVQLAGEGATTTGPNNERITATAVPSHLQCVDMKVIQFSGFIPTYGHVFYVQAPNKDISFCDTGGAAVHNGMIYGVISLGNPDYACQSSTGILDVCEYLEWIKQKTGLE